MSLQKDKSNYNTNVIEYLTTLSAQWDASEHNFKAYLALLNKNGWSYDKIADLLEPLRGKRYSDMTIMRWIRESKGGVK